MTLISQETSRATAIVYLNRNAAAVDRVRQPKYKTDDRLVFKGEHPLGLKSPADMAISGIQTTKMMGACSGTWRILVKSSIDLTDVVHENDWVDITMSRHDKSWHVMRGPVDAVQRTRNAGGRGATETIYVISGRDFGKILETQQVWYDQILDMNSGVVAGSRMASMHNDFILANPARAVEIFVSDHLGPTINNAVGYWPLPNMPNVSPDPSFVANLRFALGEYSDAPSRSLGMAPTLWSFEAPNVWALCKQFADEELNEVYVDLAAGLPTEQHGDYLGSDPYGPDDTVMALFVRDRPFPNGERDGPLSDAPYFHRIPQYDIKVQEIVSDNLTVSGLARANAFFYAPEMAQDLAKSLVNMALPLIDPDSIRYHGMRRKNVESIYFNFQGVGHLGMIESYRNVARDYHCMNHMLSTGTMNLKPGRPDIRIGGRIRVFPLTAGFSSLWTESYYVEGVSHSWNYQDGVSTALVLSRGWRGDDESFVSELQGIRKRYEVLSKRDFTQLTEGQQTFKSEAEKGFHLIDESLKLTIDFGE